MEGANLMAEGHKTGQPEVGSHGPISTRSVLGGVLAGSAIGGPPLLRMMGFSFLNSVTQLLVSLPLLLIFRPLLLGAASVFAVAVAGTVTAALTTVAGLSTLGWVFQELGTPWRFLPVASCHARMANLLAEEGERNKERGDYRSA